LFETPISGYGRLNEIDSVDDESRQKY